MANSLNVAGVLTSVQHFTKSTKALILKYRTRIFKAAGEIFKQKKEWYGVATSVNGIWTADISSAGFTEILHVYPTAIFNDTNFNNQVHASLNLVSLTALTGRVTSGGMIVLGGATQVAKSGVTAMIKVEGF